MHAAERPPHHSIGGTMLSIQLDLLGQIFTPIQKKEIIGQLTDAFIVINGKKMRSAAWVSMEEICNGEWRIG
jgi:4-oxalocrotonate tautomerase